MKSEAGACVRGEGWRLRSDAGTHVRGEGWRLPARLSAAVAHVSAPRNSAKQKNSPNYRSCKVRYWEQQQKVLSKCPDFRGPRYH